MKSDIASKSILVTAVIFMGFALSFGLLVATKYVIPTMGEIEYLSSPRMRMWHTNAIFGGYCQQIWGIIWILPQFCIQNYSLKH